MPRRHHQVIAGVAGVVMAAFCAAAAAQDATGRYAGSFTTQILGRDAEVGLTVVISSVEDGRVKGVATISGTTCGGDYPFEGFLKGSELGIRSNVKGGRAGDCAFGMRGTLEGNQIVGTYGRYAVRLTK